MFNRQQLPSELQKYASGRDHSPPTSASPIIINNPPRPPRDTLLIDRSAVVDGLASPPNSVDCSFTMTTANQKRKRKPAGTPDPGAEVVALSPKSLMESEKYVCDICNQGFQREQNLQMHRRRHKVPWKLGGSSSSSSNNNNNNRARPTAGGGGGGSSLTVPAAAPRVQQQYFDLTMGGGADQQRHERRLSGGGSADEALRSSKTDMEEGGGGVEVDGAEKRQINGANQCRTESSGGGGGGGAEAAEECRLLQGRGGGGEAAAARKVYVCPEPSCLHHSPAHALGDLVGIKKHYRRKHSRVRQWECDKCGKAYAVHSDFKAHVKTCGTRGHCCDCGRVFSRVESFIEHQDSCVAAAYAGGVSRNLGDRKTLNAVNFDQPPAAAAAAEPAAPTTVDNYRQQMVTSSSAMPASAAALSNNIAVSGSAAVVVPIRRHRNVNVDDCRFPSPTFAGYGGGGATSSFDHGAPNHNHPLHDLFMSQQRRVVGAPPPADAIVRSPPPARSAAAIASDAAMSSNFRATESTKTAAPPMDDRPTPFRVLYTSSPPAAIPSDADRGGGGENRGAASPAGAMWMDVKQRQDASAQKLQLELSIGRFYGGGGEAAAGRGGNSEGGSEERGTVAAAAAAAAEEYEAEKWMAAMARMRREAEEAAKKAAEAWEGAQREREAAETALRAAAAYAAAAAAAASGSDGSCPACGRGDVNCRESSGSR